ncbi:MAG TPA: pitrilysin family protein [Thermoanaerobaculia bacterium]|jgi:zinc protease|nr:pitrilysin family protein [Thermoanaerobaculia bacterium]
MKKSILPTLTALLLAALFTVAPGTAGAQAPAKPEARQRATPPGPGPAKEVHFPAFQEKTLANGLRIVVIEEHKDPLVSLRLVVKGGRSYEPEGKSGLAEATATLLTKGTAKRSAQQIAEAVDFVGASLNANAGLESGFATASVTSDQLDLGFDLLADIVLHPTFPQDEVDRWRRQTLSGLQIQQKSAPYLASRAVERLVFGDHPYGRPATGTPDSVRGLTRDDFAAYHKSHYLPNGSFLAVVGDVKPADAFARAERAFGGWVKGADLSLPKVTPPRYERNRIVVIDKPDAVQTEIRLAQVAIPYRDPDLFTAEVYSSVTGGSPSARLYEEIRKKRGLSYGAQSFFVEPTQPGFFEASTFTKTETSAEALKVALDVLRDLQKEPVPTAELEPAKTYITGAFPLEIETADGIADKVLEAMKFGYGREFLESYNQKISAVTAADVQRFARERIHPERMSIVLVGNASAFIEPLKKAFPDVDVIPVADLDLVRNDLRKPKTAQAAPPAASAADGKALDLLRQAQTALGGKVFVEQKTQIAKGSATMTPPGAPQPVVIPTLVSYRRYPDAERTEMTTAMGSMVRAYDGTSGWMQMGPQTVDATDQMKDRQLYGFDQLRRAGQPGFTARSLPDEPVAGKPVHVVDLADAGGHTTRFYLDPATNQVVKVGFESGGQKLEVLYSDYRDVNGVKVPFKTDVTQDGTPVMKVELSEVQVNAPVDAALFKKPGA